MKSVLEAIDGILPIDEDTIKAIADYHADMRTKVIPQINNTLVERSVRAHEVRTGHRAISVATADRGEPDSRT